MSRKTGPEDRGACLEFLAVSSIALAHSPSRAVRVAAPPCPDCWVKAVLSGSSGNSSRSFSHFQQEVLRSSPFASSPCGPKVLHEDCSLIVHRKYFGFLRLPAHCSEQQCCIEFTLSAPTGSSSYFSYCQLTVQSNSVVSSLLSQLPQQYFVARRRVDQLITP